MTTFGIVFCFSILAIAAWGVWEQRNSRQTASHARHVGSQHASEELREDFNRLATELRGAVGGTAESAQYFEAQYQGLSQQVAQVAQAQSHVTQTCEQFGQGIQQLSQGLQQISAELEEERQRTAQLPTRIDGLRAGLEETVERANRTEQGVAHLHEQVGKAGAGSGSGESNAEMAAWLDDARQMLNALAAQVTKNTAAVKAVTHLTERVVALEGGDATEYSRGQDLKLIRGIGPMIEETLNSAGISTVEDIASWTDTDIEAFCEKLPALRERLQRDRWVEQARELVG